MNSEPYINKRMTDGEEVSVFKVVPPLRNPNKNIGHSNNKEGKKDN